MQIAILLYVSRFVMHPIHESQSRSMMLYFVIFPVPCNDVTSLVFNLNTDIVMTHIRRQKHSIFPVHTCIINGFWPCFKIFAFNFFFLTKAWLSCMKFSNPAIHDRHCQCQDTLIIENSFQSNIRGSCVDRGDVLNTCMT